VKIKSVYIISFLLFTSDAWSYAIKTHSKITEYSIQQYNRCADIVWPNDLKRKIIGTDREMIAASNIHEDLNVFIKAQNWHFYRYQSELGSGTLNLGVASVELRMNHLAKYTQKDSPGNVVGNVGSISHYIQDVTNPAHVVPIYHSTGDGFDQYDFESVWPKPLDEEQCRNILTKKIEGPVELLQLYAVDTLISINNKVTISRNGIEEQTTWSIAYWAEKIIETANKHTFGSYGTLGNSFGLTEFNRNGEIVRVDANQYKEYAQSQIKKAIEGTLLIFSFYSDKEFYNRPPSIEN
jgi:hypothetical protein